MFIAFRFIHILHTFGNKVVYPNMNFAFLLKAVQKELKAVELNPII